MEQVFLTNQKLEIKMPQIFKIVNFRKYIEVEKKFRFGGVKTAK